MLLVEYTVLDELQVINEATAGGGKKLKLRGRFQKCDEQNNNGRIYPRKILEGQVKKIQEKINDRSLVGALDHPANDAIHLSQASHLITGLSVDKSGDVIGECEILSTPNGKIVEALINDGVKIGISSRGVGSVSEGREGKVVNEDFKLITFDLVSDPSTKGAFPELTESIRENSQRAQEIVSKHRKDRVLMTMLESKINQKLEEGKKKGIKVSRNKSVIPPDENTAKRQGGLLSGLYAHLARREGKRANSSKSGKTPKKGGKKQTGQMDSVEISGDAIVENDKHARRPGETVDQYNARREEDARRVRVAQAKAIADARKKEAERRKKNDSIELFGAKIFETFTALDQGRRKKRVTKVQRELKRRKARHDIGVDPEDQEKIATTFEKAGQHDLAAQARGGGMTRTPKTAQAAGKLAASEKKRGKKGSKDIAKAQAKLSQFQGPQVKKGYLDPLKSTMRKIAQSRSRGKK